MNGTYNSSKCIKARARPGHETMSFNKLHPVPDLRENIVHSSTATGSYQSLFRSLVVLQIVKETTLTHLKRITSRIAQ